MAHWEFLLQKEGDRSWLPLESPDVEILEGRYRVVARSSRVNTPVEIRVSHQSLMENPPKRRGQGRSSQTNRDGLIVVMPFTRLQPGIWELRCRCDLMSDMLGDGWQYAVQLQVLPHAVEAETWEGDWQEATDITDASAAKSLTPESTSQPAALAAITADTSALASPVLASNLSESSNTSEPQELIIESEPAPATTAASNTSTPEPPTEMLEESIQTESDLPANQLWDQAETEAEVETKTEAEAETKTEVEAVSPSVFAEVPTVDPWDSSSDAALPLATVTLPNESPEPEMDAAIDQLLAENQAPLSQMAEQLSEQLVASIFQELDESVEQIWSDQPLNDAAPAIVAAQAIATSPLRLTLREAYVIARGQPLDLSGQLESIDLPASGETFEGEIRIALRDPQGSSILVDLRQPLRGEFPLPFACTVTIPAEYQTHLLLGEVALYAATDRETALTTTAFTVTTDLDELLEAIANEFPDSDQFQPPLEFAGSPANDLNLTFLELIATPQALLQFQPSLQQPLPPQIYQPDSDRPKAKSLELPFARPQTPSPQESVAATAIDPVVSVAPVPEMQADLSPCQIPDQAIDSPAVSPDSPPDLTPDLPLEWQAVTDLIESQPQRRALDRPATPEDAAFRSLNLQQRFWSRLNSLAGDAELSDWLQKTPTSEPLLHEQLPGSVAHPGGLDADLAAQEIVVEDELSVRHKATSSDLLLEPPESLVIPKDDPIPTPQLEVPTGELMAGKPVYITVKLPNLAPRIYVKLWLRDRQTRFILDGPRWLTDLAPNGLGDLEAHTQSTVPFGCLELQFEAIAVEVATQRESHKVTIDRLVIPPDLPNLSLDELDI